MVTPPTSTPRRVTKQGSKVESPASEEPKKELVKITRPSKGMNPKKRTFEAKEIEQGQ